MPADARRVCASRCRYFIPLATDATPDARHIRRREREIFFILMRCLKVLLEALRAVRGCDTRGDARAPLFDAARSARCTCAREREF